jgi:hypothetical protein
MGGNAPRGAVDRAGRPLVEALKLEITVIRGLIK